MPMEPIEPPGDMWKFTVREQRWVWSRFDPDGNQKGQALRDFETLEECQADAARHGYAR